MSVYNYSVKAKNGDEISLETYKGKVLLIVNTATGCGFTPQYTGLQKLYDTYKEKGFEILDFPCNQFGNQAPGSDEEIHTFCVSRYAMTFPQFSKVEVNGDTAHPLFKYIREQKKGAIGSSIKWNFTKFLVDRNGTVVRRFAPTDTPESIEQHIVNLL